MVVTEQDMTDATRAAAAGMALPYMPGRTIEVVPTSCQAHPE
jgi:hypothetical protein